MAERSDIVRGPDWDDMWNCQSSADWDAAEISIKARHSDTLPPDWDAVVINTDFKSRIFARWESNGFETL